MQNVSYDLIVSSLFRVEEGALCGSSAEVAILDAGVEVDRITLRGKVGPGGTGYRRPYAGKPGLTAKIAVGDCSFTFARAA